MSVHPGGRLVHRAALRAWSTARSGAPPIAGRTILQVVCVAFQRRKAAFI